jgi:hypothetical protein
MLTILPPFFRAPGLTISGKIGRCRRQQKGGPRRDLLSPRIRSRCQDEFDFVTSVGLWWSDNSGRDSRRCQILLHGWSCLFQTLAFRDGVLCHRPDHTRGRNVCGWRMWIRPSTPHRAQRNHLSEPSRKWRKAQGIHANQRILCLFGFCS